MSALPVDPPPQSVLSKGRQKLGSLGRSATRPPVAISAPTPWPTVQPPVSPSAVRLTMSVPRQAPAPPSAQPSNVIGVKQTFQSTAPTSPTSPSLPPLPSPSISGPLSPTDSRRVPAPRGGARPTPVSRAHATRRPSNRPPPTSSTHPLPPLPAIRESPSPGLQNFPLVPPVTPHSGVTHPGRDRRVSVPDPSPALTSPRPPTPTSGSRYTQIPQSPSEKGSAREGTVATRTTRGGSFQQDKTSTKAASGDAATVKKRYSSGILSLLRGAPPPAPLPPTNSSHTVAERLQHTIDSAEYECNRQMWIDKFYSSGINLIILLQLLSAGAITILSSLSGKNNIATAVLGAFATILAGLLARHRGTNQPERAIAHAAALRAFLNECDAIVEDYGDNTGSEYDAKLNELRSRFEIIEINAETAARGLMHRSTTSATPGFV